METTSEIGFTLGARLEACASFVRKGKVPADIGTDHAYLPIRLVQNGTVPFAFASDINEEPVRSAVNNIQRYGLNDKVITFTGDGLERISPDKVDDIIIAGMGGDNIADILSRAEWLKDARYRLILQPMSRVSRLREYLYRNGFDIKEEKAVCEANRIYTVILSQYSGTDFRYDDCDIYSGRLDPNDPNAAALMLKQAGILLSAAKGCAAKGDYSGQARYLRLADRLIQNAKGAEVK